MTDATAKTARQLLEEAATYFATPVLRIDGQDYFTWMTGDEFEHFHYVDSDRGSQVEVLDSDWAGQSDGAYVRAACAIGALALANLLEEVKENPNNFLSWDSQNQINPQVSIATIALAYEAFARIQEMMQGMESLKVTFFEELFKTTSEPFSHWFKMDDPAQLETAARTVVNLVTHYNDTYLKSASEAVDFFNGAIKRVLVAEETV